MSKFLSPAEHGKYWHDWAQERLAKLSEVESENRRLAKMNAQQARTIRRFHRLAEAILPTR